MNKFLAIFLLAFSLSCSDPQRTESGDITDIYGNVYDAIASRANASSSWYKSEGRLAFAIEQGADTSSGVGIISMSNFNEPQYCGIAQDCACTGTVQFNFTVSNASPPVTQTSNKPYNVFDTSSDPTQNVQVTQEVFKISTYQIDIKPTSVNLTKNCRIQEQRQLTIIKYSTGEIILKDVYREIAMDQRVTTQ